MPDKSTLEEFNLTGALELLPGGSTKTFRVGNVVLKHIRETSLENNHSLDLIQWIADFSMTIQQVGFRLPRPVHTKSGTWITADGWTAWTVVAGRHATKEDVPQCINGIIALHKAIKNVPKNDLLDDNQTPWGKADRWCWGDKPSYVHPKVKGLVETLYELRKPVSGLESQVIHGDLNPENILIAPNLPPAFIDFSPFWRPAEFALAMFANWIGPRMGDASILAYFKDIRAFDQLLIRAGIRMLLIVSELDGLDGWEKCSEKRAAEIIIEYITKV